jgi:hypothetical protein
LGAINTDSANITREGDNYLEFSDDSNTVEKHKTSSIWKRCADYIIEGEKICLELSSLKYVERKISRIVLAFVDVTANKVVKANEYSVGLCFLIPVVTFVSVLLMYILHALQDIHSVLADKVFVEGTVVDNE